MKLEFPEGYQIQDESGTVYTIHGRDFTGDQFRDLVTQRRGERISDHVCRLSLALGVGMVTVLSVRRSTQ